MAQRDSGQPRRIAAFLLSIYNGRRFPITRLAFSGLLLIIRGLWALPWWLLLIVVFVGALSLQW